MVNSYLGTPKSNRLVRQRPQPGDSSDIKRRSGEYDTARVRFSHSDEFVGMFMPYELESSICSKLCAFMTEPCTSRTLFGQDQLINELLRDE
jgi:hypothetical protein